MIDPTDLKEAPTNCPMCGQKYDIFGRYIQVYDTADCSKCRLMTIYDSQDNSWWLRKSWFNNNQESILYWYYCRGNISCLYLPAGETGYKEPISSVIYSFDIDQETIKMLKVFS
jgi:hypothetical protein